VRAIQLSALASGREIHEINPSNRSSPTTMDHPHYAVNDLNRDFALDDIPPNSVVVCVDTDYYVEDWTKVFGAGVPVLLYSFSPTQVAGRDGEARFLIRDDTVEYQVPGGGRWVHKVWNWADFGEFVEHDLSWRQTGWTGRFLMLFGLRKVVFHKICHARPFPECPHRLVVWAVPQHTVWRLPFHSEIAARRIRRMRFADPNRPGWNSIVYVGPDKTTISFGRENSDAQVTMDKPIHDVLMGLASDQSVSARAIATKAVTTDEIPLLMQYYKGTQLALHQPDTVACPAKVEVHWPSAMYADKPETSARQISPPLVSDQNMVPFIKRWEAVSASIDERVTFATNLTVPKDTRIHKFAVEFLKLVAPDAGSGSPYSLEETRELLNKPSQQLLVKRVWDEMDTDHKAAISSFIKNEATNKPARIISAFRDFKHLLRFSSYTLKFRDEVLHAPHNAHWFCPGLEPPALAHKVCLYASSVARVAEGDFTNMDGTVSPWLQRNVTNATYHRYFMPEFQKPLQEMTGALISAPARTKRFGFRYEAGPGVKSGSPTTCDANTVLTAFTQYAAIRLTDPELTEEEAFGNIGLCFGDDSLFDDRYTRKWNMVVKFLGMKLKVEAHQPDLGVCFLSRVFPRPCDTYTSFQDPLRTFRKLHLTFREPSVPLADAALDRTDGYLATDAHTPVIAAYCHAIQRVYQEEASPVIKRLSRRATGRDKPYWYSSTGAWPQNAADRTIMLECMSARTGIEVEQLTEMERVLATAKSVCEFPTVNRDAPANPYAGTIGPCGEVDSVDLVKVTIQQNIVNSRATEIEGYNDSPGLPLSCDAVPSAVAGAGNDALCGDNKSLATGAGQRQEGRARTPRHAEQAGKNVRQRGGRPAREAIIPELGSGLPVRTRGGGARGRGRGNFSRGHGPRLSNRGAARGSR